MKKKKRPKTNVNVVGRMLRDVSKIRFQLAGVVAMALIIIACNMLSPRLVGGIVGKISDFLTTGGEGSARARFCCSRRYMPFTPFFPG